MKDVRRPNRWPKSGPLREEALSILAQAPKPVKSALARLARGLRRAERIRRALLGDRLRRRFRRTRRVLGSHLAGSPVKTKIEARAARPIERPAHDAGAGKRKAPDARLLRSAQGPE